jgi:hypothetical protein
MVLGLFQLENYLFSYHELEAHVAHVFLSPTLELFRLVAKLEIQNMTDISVLQGKAPPSPGRI